MVKRYEIMATREGVSIKAFCSGNYVLHSDYAALQASHARLLEALTFLWNEYKSIADSGDAGFWSAEETPEGIKAMAAIDAAQPFAEDAK